MAEEARWAAWLQERRGGLAPPSEHVATALGELRAANEIDRTMVVTKTSTLAKEDAREMWTAVFVEVNTILERENHATMSAIAAQRMVAWAVQPSLVMDPPAVTRDRDDVTMRDGPPARGKDKRRR